MPAPKPGRSMSGFTVAFPTVPYRSMPTKLSTVNGLRKRRSINGCATSLAILPPLSLASGKRARSSSRLARSHPHALHRLEELAFRLDARGNDDFRFLELADGRCADIAHAGRNGADQVLGSIIHRRRTE